jgi:hypothetical protein
MPALVAGISLFSLILANKTWMAGTSPAVAIVAHQETPNVHHLQAVHR